MDCSYEEYKPQILLLASRYDLTCDYVVAKLRCHSVSYLRLNSEDLNEFKIELDPVDKGLIVEKKNEKFCVSPQYLKSVFFRRPVFLRDYGDDNRSPSERFSRIQWSAFIKNLMIFSEALWINHPVSIYRAEHKAYQLNVAAELGFSIPKTRITNTPRDDIFENNIKRVALKGIDTVLIRDAGMEMFGFTTFDYLDSLNPDEWHSAPTIIQSELKNKLDIRVTVVGENVFPASITINNEGIIGDWRSNKERANFQSYELPTVEVDRCRLLLKKLDLTFGGIDLAYCDGEYYFLEINPTGEWAWLVDSAKLPIDTAISNILCGIK